MSAFRPVVAALFVLTWLSGGARGAPVVFWGGDALAPGNLVLLYGGGLADTKEVRVRVLPDGGAVAAPALQACAESVKFVLPARLAPGVYSVQAGAAAPFIDHQGRATPDAVRHDLSRHLADPRFFHFGTDAKGTKLVTDTFDEHGDTCLYLADLAGDTLANYRYLLNTRITGINGAHAHPFLSPDGKTAFFNSDEAGVLQAYMVRVG